MLFKRKNNFAELLATIESTDRRILVAASVNPMQTSLAWLRDSGLNYTVGDVLHLAAMLKDRLP